MKILSLRFKNLNSICGEWLIDFTHQAYVSDGIFAITGPTGSGKTTILDAISLALYGKTPRLKKITKEENEIMSRQCGECFSEVLFETEAGQFRVHWAQHRAKKKAEGELQQPKHEISDGHGKTLETKLTEVAKKIEEVTGMDFYQFTRSMLLAQGGFAAFLQAKGDERAPILESITGTEIYSEISKKSFERAKEEKSKLDFLEAEISGIMILSKEDEQKIQEELLEKEQVADSKRADCNNITKKIQHLKDIEKIKAELIAIEAEFQKLMFDKKAFEPQKLVIEKALKAAEIEGIYASCSEKRNAYKKEMEQLEIWIKEIPEKEKNLSVKDESHKKAVENIDKLRIETRSSIELIKKIRELDFTISEKIKSIKNEELELDKIKKLLSTNCEMKTNYEKKELLQKEELIKTEKYLAVNINDSFLVTELAGIKELFKSCFESEKNYKLSLIELEKSGKEIDAETKNIAKAEVLKNTEKKKSDELKKELEQITQSLSKLMEGKLLREYQAEKEYLIREALFLKKIVSLEDERKKLVDGIPCPLCGSIDHPFVTEKIPEIDEVEVKIETLNNFIKEAETLEDIIKNKEKLSTESALKLITLEKEMENLINKKIMLEKRGAEIEENVKTIANNFNKNKNIVYEKLSVFIKSEDEITDFEKISEMLENKVFLWKETEKNKENIQKILSEISGEIKSFDSLIGSLRESLKTVELKVSQINADMENLKKERWNLFCDRNPDQEEKTLSKNMENAETKEKSEREILEKEKTALNGLKVRIAALFESTSTKKTDLANSEKILHSGLLSQGFESENLFLEARLDTLTRDKISQQVKVLEENIIKNSELKKDRAQKLKEKTDENISEESISELETIEVELGALLKSLGEEIGAIKQKIADNQKNTDLFADKKNIILQQKKEWEKWNMLSSLIGSADGKKFRNFAQGLTFDMMISYANKELEKMTDRYLLIRNKSEPLELSVIDSYQAGEIRSTKNLSGGESFIVSLALALGLSKMASKKVRIDSLFLDEGFGTLDEDALEVALEMLAGLQQRGKLIGIISHVSALKERISTQIKVIAHPGGKSVLSGHGVILLTK